MKILFSLLLVFFFFSCQNESFIQKQNEYPIRPVPFTEVKMTDNFWSQRIKTNHDVTIPIAIQKSEETGRVDNFRIAGGLMEGEFCSPYPFDDSDIYKIIEGAAYSLQMFPDEKLEKTVDSLITLIGLAQEDDGYLFTNRTIMGENGHEWIGKTRWEKVDDLSHELYNLGHFYEAAVAYFQTTGKREILDIAIKSANLVDRDFGPGKIENWPGHQEIEIGLVKLYRTTGEKRYLDLAKFFLDVRGKGIGTPNSYNQSHKPVVEQHEAVGHSVRAAYMWTGMADVAALTGDQSYIDAISKIWEDVVYTKLYITGGIGAEGGHEGFGGPYELPNGKAYCETCAAIANVFWNHRMFLMTGDAKFMDVLERSLYNNVLSGVGLSGDLFFYPNPLESHGQHQRSEWFGCACCPSNISRFIPSMPNYMYAQKNSNIYVNLYAASQTSFEVNNSKIDIEQITEMPWNGNVVIKVKPEMPVRATFHIRIPGWANSQPVPGDLYKFENSPSQPVSILVNGRKVKFKLELGYAVVEQKWKAGDEIQVDFPMDVRRITAHPEVKANIDKMALQRGPLVYCVEWPDVPDSLVLNLVTGTNADISVKHAPGLLNGVYTLDFLAQGTKRSTNGEIDTYPKHVTAIPYYGWAHRGRGEMAVWLATEKEVSLPLPAPTLASRSAIKASHPTAALRAINDQIYPKSSGDETNLFYHTWPRKRQTEWIEYHFPEPATISESRVYWFDDEPRGACRVPEKWNLFYLANGKWNQVKTSSEYIVVKDDWNKLKFQPVTTSAIRLEMNFPGEFSGGLHEWEVL
jgi:uncharacterized protein